jgi:hypothetical protein
MHQLHISINTLTQQSINLILVAFVVKMIDDTIEDSKVLQFIPIGFNYAYHIVFYYLICKYMIFALGLLAVNVGIILSFITTN